MMTPDDVVRLLEPYPQTPLGHYPTPLEAAPRLGDMLDVELSIKRDDATGLAFGGNKIRQLEFYLGKAPADGADTILITGAVQSNYVRAAAAAAARLGLRCHVQLEDRVPLTDAAYIGSGNVLLDRLLGATVHTYPEGEDEAGADARLYEIAEADRRQGFAPYVIPLGPGNPPLGALGYVKGAAELAKQLKNPASIDAFVVPSGSGMTHAGLLVGLRALGIAAPVFGICVRRGAAAQAARIAAHCRNVEAMLGLSGAVAGDDIRTMDDVLAPGYGRLNDATYDAVLLAARREGLLLDTVYSGRALAGLVHLAAAGEIAPGSKVVFLHTGGTPALFGYSEVLNDRLAGESTSD